MGICQNDCSMRVAAILAAVVWAALVHAQPSATARPAALPASTGELQLKAEAGDPAAQFELGVRYHEGRGVTQSYGEAFRWFRMSAEQGEPDAEFNTGVMYEKGRGVAPDYAEALRWYQKAAVQDYAPAEFNLGVLYDKGRGVTLDFAQAMSWYRKAADQSYAAAQYNLGLLYYYGQGTPLDYVQAYKWISVAAGAASGEDKSKFAAMRDEIGRKMTVQDLVNAQKLASQWTPAAVH